MKITAILTVNKDKEYNICGWSSENSIDNHIRNMKALSEEGLDYNSDSPTKQYLVEFEVEDPNFLELEKVDQDKIKVELI